MSRKMKDSGIEWIGEIPEEWGVRKIKNSFIIISGNGFPIVIQGQEQGDYPVCKASDISINNGKIIFSSDNYITQKQSIAFNIIPKGSVVFPKIGEAMKKNNRALLGVDACLDNNCQGLVPLCMNKKYPLYMLSCIDMFWYDNAGTVPCINNLRFSNSYIPFPLISEQQKIALFLDKKCSEIDSLTADIQKQIEILEQYKKSVITETVTKGLDPNVKMKDSGIEWISEVPEEWKIKRIKYMFNVVSGSTPKSDNFDYWDGDVIWITPADYKTLDKHIGNSSRNISKLGLQSCSTTLVPKESIIFSKRAPIGTVAIAAVNLCTNQGCLSCIPKQEVYSLFYYYVMSIATEDFELKGSGTTFKEISTTAFNDSQLPFPPFSVQQQIASYLDSKCSKLDELMRLKNQQLETLMQYKKSLIYEYVTGKREVN